MQSRDFFDLSSRRWNFRPHRHTQRNDATGELIGPRFGGSTAFTEDQFVARFRTGRVLPGSPTPWQGFSRLDESDIRAIYRYLRTVPPVRRESGPAFVDAKRK